MEGFLFVCFLLLCEFIFLLPTFLFIVLLFWNELSYSSCDWGWVCELPRRLCEVAWFHVAVLFSTSLSSLIFYSSNTFKWPGKVVSVFKRVGVVSVGNEPCALCGIPEPPIIGLRSWKVLSHAWSMGLSHSFIGSGLPALKALEFLILPSKLCSLVQWEYVFWVRFMILYYSQNFITPEKFLKENACVSLCRKSCRLLIKYL